MVELTLCVKVTTRTSACSDFTTDVSDAAEFLINRNLAATDFISEILKFYHEMIVKNNKIKATGCNDMGRFMKFGRRNNSTITYTKDEPYAICFYLFNLFEEKSNLNVIEDNDEAIRLFLENTDRLNKN